MSKLFESEANRIALTNEDLEAYGPPSAMDALMSSEYSLYTFRTSA